MIEEIIQPIIEKRSWEAVMICESSNDDITEKFIKTIKTIRKFAPAELLDSINELEDLFVQKQTEIIRLAHNKGFEDGLHLYKEIKTFL